MDFEKFCLCCKSHNTAFICGVLSSILFGAVFVVTISSDIFVEKHLVGKSYIEIHKTPLFWILIAESIVNFITSIFLIVGVVKKNHYMMMPWIVVIGIELIPFALVAFVGLLLAIPICGPIYSWWYICSTYQNIKKVAAELTTRDQEDST